MQMTVSAMQSQPIPGRLLNSPNLSGKARKVVLIYRAGGLIGTGDRDMVFQQSRSAALFSVWLAIRPSRNTGILPWQPSSPSPNGRRRAALVCGPLAGSTGVGLVSSTTSLRQTDEGASRPSLLGGAKCKLDTTSASASDAVDFHRVFGYRAEHRHRIHTLAHCLALSARFYRTAQRHHRIAFAVSGGHTGNQIEQPGPEVTSATPCFPGDAVQPAAAIKAALALRWRTGIMRIEESSSANQIPYRFCP